ncbi:hypothetical protein OIU78_008189 [Salix suchowensis]|nr:hypothetical protein OIU78_008189 [Salix suchowensis]
MLYQLQCTSKAGKSTAERRKREKSRGHFNSLEKASPEGKKQCWIWLSLWTRVFKSSSLVVDKFGYLG